MEDEKTTAGDVIAGLLHDYVHWTGLLSIDREDLARALRHELSTWRQLADDEAEENADSGDVHQGCAKTLRFYEAALELAEVDERGEVLRHRAIRGTKKAAKKPGKR